MSDLRHQQHFHHQDNYKYVNVYAFVITYAKQSMTLTNIDLCDKG